MSDDTFLTVYSLFLVTFVSLSRQVCADGHQRPDVSVVSYDPDSFAKGLEGNRNFVMFYAPWCGHCKSLTPMWDELARIYNSVENSPIVIAKVDCTLHTSLCAEHNIIGFPTLKLFSVGGKQHRRYKGRRDLGFFKHFIQQQDSDAESDAEDDKEGPQETAEHTRTGPATLTNENFAEQVDRGHFFIEFFAPWCGHCKQLAPIWDDLADTFNPLNKVTIAKVDCTEHEAVCKQYGIPGYPTLLWFKDGKQIESYRGTRSYDALKYYVLTKLAQDGAYGNEEKVPDSGKMEKVVKLTYESFENHLSSNDFVFIKFFVEWCDHCKKLAPVWVQLADAFHDQPVSIAEVDCTRYGTLCKKHQVSGYPTMKLFHRGQFIQNYRSFRTYESLQGFLMKHLQEHQREEL